MPLSQRIFTTGALQPPSGEAMHGAWQRDEWESWRHITSIIVWICAGPLCIMGCCDSSAVQMPFSSLQPSLQLKLDLSHGCWRMRHVASADAR